MKKSNQIKAFRSEYVGEGCFVELDAPASSCGLDLPFPLDLLAKKRDGSFVIVEVAGWDDRSDEEAMTRFEQIGTAISDRIDIDYQIRFFDCSEDLFEKTDKLLSRVKKLRREAADKEPYDKVLQIMAELGL